LVEPDSLSNNIPLSLYQDKKGVIWVGTFSGLNQLNNRQTGFTHYFHSKNQADSLSNNHVTAINEDNTGRFWIGTENGINLTLDATKKQFKRYLFVEDNGEAKIKINFLQAIENTILASTNNGLYVYDDNSDEFIPFDINLNGINNKSSIITSFVDSKNTLWLSVAEKGVYFRKVDNKHFEKFKKLDEINNFSVITNQIMSINEDESGNIWLGSKYKGLLIYHPEQDNLTLVQMHSNSQVIDSESLCITSILRDSSGLMWIGTQNYGIIQWNPKSVYISHFDKAELLSSESALGAMIWNFEEDIDGNIWIATFAGVKVLDPETDTITFISIKSETELKEPTVNFISRDGNQLWFSTENGIIGYLPGVGVNKRILNSGIGFSLPKDSAIFSSQTINGLLYVAVEEYGLLSIDIENSQIRQIPIKSTKTNSPSTNDPITLKIGSDNSLWVLSSEGIYNYSPELKRFRLAITEGIEQLSNQYVSAFHQSSSDRIWLGTSGNGINLLSVTDYDKGIYTLKQYNHIEDLKHQIINGLVVDDETSANLWITTHTGLYRFNIETENIRKFSAADGIQAKEFNEGAYLKDSKGNIYFGGANGFNLLRRPEFSNNNFDAPLRITSITIQCSVNISPCNEKFDVFDSEFICDHVNCADKQLKQLKLPSELEQLEISFASLDYTNPEINNYRYRLFSDNEMPWINLNNENTLLFTKLKSNDYILEIQGSNYQGSWSPQIAKIKFSVDSPWYMKKYSYLLLAIIIAFTVYLIISNRRYKLQEEENVKKAILKSEENFKFALWGSGDELWEWKVESDEVIRTNPIKSIKLPPKVTVNTMSDFLELVHPDDKADTQQAFVQHIRGKTTHFESFFRIVKDSGNYMWVLSRGRVVEREQTGKALRLVGSIKDVTLIKSTEDKLTLVAKAFENTMDGISILDPDFKAVFNNQAFYKITNLTSSEAINKQYFFSEQSNNHDKYQQIKIALRNFGEWEGELWEIRNDGERFAIELKIDSVLDNNRNISNYICIFSDITYRKKSEEELRKLANFDALTGLPNRSLFMDRLTQAVAFAKRNDSKFALLFIDLDHFKNINDSLGHAVGDELLRKVSKRLGRCVRDVDTIARLGGDEFVIILENIHNADEVGVCADKIINRMLKSFDISGSILKISPSIGIGIFPSDGHDIETLFKNADMAMYSAKEKGRNNYQFFTSDMTSSAIERINIENKLREAIELQQLELYYQPKVYSVTGELTGFEALIRWIHPEEGMISPAAFIPIAEETGLILSMGDWILEEAIRQAKAWSKINSKCCSIAINLSARQFQQENLSDTIARLLEKYDLPAQFIELEITEGTLMSNMDHTISTLEKLQSMGISLSLDDFGTGYSSLSYLKRFPVNKLKVDQSFVRDITTDPGDASIVASIISLAHNLGLNVIAEGCETLEQLSFICSYHCEEVQGYLFSRPLPGHEAEEILKDGHILINRD